MDFYETTWQRYSDATNTILTNHSVIKYQWLIVCVINYLVINCLRD